MSASASPLPASSGDPAGAVIPGLPGGPAAANSAAGPVHPSKNPFHAILGDALQTNANPKPESERRKQGGAGVPVLALALQPVPAVLAVPVARGPLASRLPAPAESSASVAVTERNEGSPTPFAPRLAPEYTIRGADTAATDPGFRVPAPPSPALSVETVPDVPGSVPDESPAAEANAFAVPRPESQPAAAAASQTIRPEAFDFLSAAPPALAPVQAEPEDASPRAPSQAPREASHPVIVALPVPPVQTRSHTRGAEGSLRDVGTPPQPGLPPHAIAPDTPADGRAGLPDSVLVKPPRASASAEPPTAGTQSAEQIEGATRAAFVARLVPLEDQRTGGDGAPARPRAAAQPPAKADAEPAPLDPPAAAPAVGTGEGRPPATSAAPKAPAAPIDLAAAPRSRTAASGDSRPDRHDGPELPHPPDVPATPAMESARAAAVTPPSTRNQPAAAPAESRPAAPAAASEAVRVVSPARDIRLQVSGGEHRVDVRLTERGGEVQVAVRTLDSRLTSALRDDLPALTARLEQSGFRAETWHPAAALSDARLRPAETQASGASTDHSGSGRRGGEEQQTPERPQPAPETESEPDTPPTGFSWLFSALQ